MVFGIRGENCSGKSALAVNGIRFTPIKYEGK